MRIDRLRAKDVRNLRDVELQPAAGLNLISGVNAAGKTALLEAMHLLARARSFRTPRAEEVVHHQSASLQVTARIHHGTDGSLETGIERGEGRWLLRYGGEPVKSISAHARKFPMVLVTPDSQQLFLGGPKLRRHWLDWAMFHVELGYVELWRGYHRALRQRNHLLKRAAREQELEVWEELMASSGEALGAARRRYVQRLEETLAELCRNGWQCGRPGIHLEQGWEEHGQLREQLARTRRVDSQMGHTACGPHRADIAFRIDESEVAARCSRGQSKEFILLLMLAQAGVIAASIEEEPLLLIDDFAAEMDRAAQERLLALLRGWHGQVFLTCVQAGEEWSLPEGAARFHVEHGAVAKW